MNANYFTSSYIVTIVGFILAYIWGEYHIGQMGLQCLFIAFILSVLEVSLSFDNAVVNAAKLEHMSKKWQQRFLTWGIAIAVFGMRFVFPILVVAIFANLGFVDVAKMAVTDSTKYAHYLHVAHPTIITFGGTFLMMLFLSYFISPNKDVFWIKPIESKLAKIGHYKSIQTVLTLLMLYTSQIFIPEDNRANGTIAGMWGVVIYLLIDGLTHLLAKRSEELAKLEVNKTAKTSCLASFLYLEVIDASFSLDGVLGAFALTKDIIIITVGLSIGAMFVRSLTIMLVEKKTLNKYIYLEHGAHWAIGALALIMMISAIKEVPEVITGFIGLIFIVASFICSLRYNKKQKNLIA